MKIINLDGKEIDYIEGMQVKMDNGIYYIMSDEEILALQPDLAVLKRSKLELLEKVYTGAQYIKVVNGHTFYIPLKGEFYNTHITQKLTVAQSRGYATLVAQDMTGAGITIEDVPYSFWKKFIEVADPISISNFNLKNSYLEQIKIATQEELAIITFSFPAIKEVLMDLPDVNNPLQIAKNKKKIEISAYKDYRLSLPTPQTVIYEGILSNRNFKIKEESLSFFTTQIVYLKDQIELGVENPTRTYTDADNVALQLTLNDFRSLLNHANERDAQEQSQCNLKKIAVQLLNTIEEVEVFDITQIIL